MYCQASIDVDRMRKTGISCTGLREVLGQSLYWIALVVDKDPRYLGVS